MHRRPRRRSRESGTGLAQPQQVILPALLHLDQRIHCFHHFAERGIAVVLEAKVESSRFIIGQTVALCTHASPLVLRQFVECLDCAIFVSYDRGARALR